MLSLIQSVCPLSNIKKLFSSLSVSDDEPLSTLKITTFSTKSSPKLNKLSPSNAISQPSKINLLSTAFLTILIVLNKGFFSGKLLVGLRGQLVNS